MIIEKKQRPADAVPPHETYVASAIDGTKRASMLYLVSVPFLALILGFGVGHVGYQWYIPIWLLNGLLMVVALLKLVRSQPARDPLIGIAALLLITPWVIFAIFAGMGRPPQSIKGWLELIDEQHVRYNLVILGGVLAYLGTALLYQFLKHKEKVFTTLGLALMTLALPLFVLNMAYWGSFLSEAFNHFKTAERPDWFPAFQELFLLIDTVHVSMIYLAGAMFAIALGKVGYFRPAAVRIYVIVCLSAVLVGLIPPSAPVPFSVISYFVSIPAVQLIILYLMGINLLLRTAVN